jgi:hypothetical protein
MISFFVVNGEKNVEILFLCGVLDGISLTM